MSSPGDSGVFRDRVVVVTGASSGIGEATARAFAAAGAKVVATARSASALDALAAASAGAIHAIACDLADPAAIDRLFAETEQRFGSCDILVNNAGAIAPKPLVDTTPAEWDAIFAVNTRAVYLTARRSLPAMLARGTGAIVNVASISGVPGPQKFPGFVSYCASKAAVIALTEALSVEVKGRGVRVNCISPGSVDTPMLRRAGLEPDMTPEEVAETILWLASPASRPIQGQNLHVYGT